MRFFVIGNGPSLNDTPLDALIGEKTVALNRINLIYPHTKWRPTIYCKTDHNPYLVDIYNEENILNVEIAEKSYLWEDFRDGHPDKPFKMMPVGMGSNSKVTWIERCEHHEHLGGSKYCTDTWHLPRICTAFGGINAAMQIAVLEGATEIYLLGCDLGYGREIGRDHFSTEYANRIRPLGAFENKNQHHLHTVANNSCPIPIYNATIGGNLEVYERIDLCQLL